ADRFFQLMKNQIRQFARKMLTSYLGEIEERILKTDSPYRHSVSIALAIFYSFVVSPSAGIYSRARDFAFDIAHTIDPGIDKDNKADCAAICESAIYVDRVTNRARPLHADGVGNIVSYLEATKLLLDCLKTDCYVSKSVREAIYDDALSAVAFD
ncbi:MAG: NACHT C-terminal helical domain 2-containing protein, partial [Blastocatellia bacterium]